MYDGPMILFKSLLLSIVSLRVAISIACPTTTAVPVQHRCQLPQRRGRYGGICWPRAAAPSSACARRQQQAAAHLGGRAGGSHAPRWPSKRRRALAMATQAAAMHAAAARLAGRVSQWPRRRRPLDLGIPFPKLQFYPYISH